MSDNEDEGPRIFTGRVVDVGPRSGCAWAVVKLEGRFAVRRRRRRGGGPPAPRKRNGRETVSAKGELPSLSVFVEYTLELLPAGEYRGERQYEVTQIRRVKAPELPPTVLGAARAMARTRYLGWMHKPTARLRGALGSDARGEDLLRRRNVLMIDDARLRSWLLVLTDHMNAPPEYFYIARHAGVAIAKAAYRHAGNALERLRAVARAVREQPHLLLWPNPRHPIGGIRAARDACFHSVAAYAACRVSAGAPTHPWDTRVRLAAMFDLWAKVARRKGAWGGDGGVRVQRGAPRPPPAPAPGPAPAPVAPAPPADPPAPSDEIPDEWDVVEETGLSLAEIADIMGDDDEPAPKRRAPPPREPAPPAVGQAEIDAALMAALAAFEAPAPAAPEAAAPPVALPAPVAPVALPAPVGEGEAAECLVAAGVLEWAAWPGTGTDPDPVTATRVRALRDAVDMHQAMNMLFPRRPDGAPRVRVVDMPCSVGTDVPEDLLDELDDMDALADDGPGMVVVSPHWPHLDTLYRVFGGTQRVEHTSTLARAHPVTDVPVLVFVDAHACSDAAIAACVAVCVGARHVVFIGDTRVRGAAACAGGGTLWTEIARHCQTRGLSKVLATPCAWFARARDACESVPRVTVASDAADLAAEIRAAPQGGVMLIDRGTARLGAVRAAFDRALADAPRHEWLVVCGALATRKAWAEQRVIRAGERVFVRRIGADFDVARRLDDVETRVGASLGTLVRTELLRMDGKRVPAAKPLTWRATSGMREGNPSILVHLTARLGWADGEKSAYGASRPENVCVPLTSVVLDAAECVLAENVHAAGLHAVVLLVDDRVHEGDMQRVCAALLDTGRLFVVFAPDAAPIQAVLPRPRFGGRADWEPV